MTSATTLRAMTAADYEATLVLWQDSMGVGLSSADERGAIDRFLVRNPDLSSVAVVEREEGERLVGAVLCGHDGRRGYIHHLAVHPDYRRLGIGRRLVGRCLDGLRHEGIQKCHLFVFGNNRPAVAFWKRIGWITRGELEIMSRFVEPPSDRS